MQCLARLPSLQEYFLNTRSNTIVRLEGTVTLALRLFLMTLWRHEKRRSQKAVNSDASNAAEVVSENASLAATAEVDSSALERATRRLFEEIGDKSPRFRGWAQQDAHELLLTLLWTIDEEEQARLRAGSAMKDQPPTRKAPGPEHSFVRDIFECRVEDRLEIPGNLGKSQVRHEECLALSLPVLRYRQVSDIRVKGGRNEEQPPKDTAARTPIASTRENASNPIVDPLTGKENTNAQQATLAFDTELVDADADNDDDEPDSRLACVSSLFDDVDLDDMPTRRSSPGRTRSSSSPPSGVAAPGGLLALTCEPANSDGNATWKSEIPETCSRLFECLAEWARTEVVEFFQSAETPKRESHLDAALCEDHESALSSSISNYNQMNDGIHAMVGGQVASNFGAETENCVHSSPSRMAALPCSMSLHASNGVDVHETSSRPRITPDKAWKWMRLENMPQCLILHMKRFTQLEAGYITKIDDHISFPASLRLSDLAETDALTPMDTSVLESTSYELCGVVEHNGTLHFGHYVAYVRASRDAHGNWQWYYCSDRHVRSCTIDEVLHAQAYLLFYVQAS
jgi:hypothetical protein